MYPKCECRATRSVESPGIHKSCVNHTQAAPAERDDQPISFAKFAPALSQFTTFHQALR
jgi:hypothetical protein